MPPFRGIRPTLFAFRPFGRIVVFMDEARYTKEVALKVDAAIKTAGENSNSVAVAAGIPRTTLNRHLLGKTPGFTAVQLHSIAQHLGMSASDFTPDAAE